MSLTGLFASFLFLFQFQYVCLYLLWFSFYTVFIRYLFCLFVFDGMIRLFTHAFSTRIVRAVAFNGFIYS